MEFLYILGFIGIIILFFVIKNYVWDKPQEKIVRLYRELNQQKSDHNKELNTQKNNYEEELRKVNSEKDQLNARLQDSIFLSEVAKSNLRAIPYMSAIMAEFETYGLEKLARKLDWGHSQERLKKVKHIREIKRDAEAMVAKNKEALYQLEYLLNNIVPMYKASL